jgi:hypothetical protein
MYQYYYKQQKAHIFFSAIFSSLISFLALYLMASISTILIELGCNLGLM